MGNIVVSEDYLESINRVLKFVDENLDSELKVDRLAEIALFSKFHFHRIFKAATGENVATHVIRRRLERAVFLFKSDPDLSVTQVALQVGFQSPEHFSRSFKDKFGVSPKEFRQADADDLDSLKNRKIYQEVSENSFYRIYEQSRQMEADQFSVRVSEQAECDVAFVSECFGADGLQLVDAYNHLLDWAGKQGLLNEDTRQFAISRDDVEVTPAEQYRLEFCVSIPRDTKVSGRIGKGTIAGGLYALVEAKGDIYHVAKAWDHLYKRWLPTSGYRPIDEPAVEFFRQGSSEIDWEHFHLDAGVPVVISR